VLWVKIRLTEAFPQNYDEVLNCYGYGIVFAPKQPPAIVALPNPALPNASQAATIYGVSFKPGLQDPNWWTRPGLDVLTAEGARGVPLQLVAETMRRADNGLIQQETGRTEISAGRIRERLTGLVVGVVVEAGVVDAIRDVKIRLLAQEFFADLPFHRVTPVGVKPFAGVETVGISQIEVVLVGPVVISEGEAGDVGAQLAEHDSGDIGVAAG